MYQIIYCSRNRIGGNPVEVATEIDRLLVRSRRKNLATEITGALLFNGEAFAQVLEGPRGAVDELYGAICKDSRHSNVVLLEEIKIAERDFLNWAMGYSGSEAGRAFYEHLNLEEIRTNPAGVARRIVAFLKSVVNVYD